MSNFRRSLISSSAGTGEYEFELNDYTLDGNNWIDTGLFPYNSGKNFEIETIVDTNFYRSSYNQAIVCLSTGKNTSPKYQGVRILFDAGTYQRYYISAGYGVDFGFIYKSAITTHTYKYIYNNGNNYYYVDGTLVNTIYRIINNTFSLKIGIGNYEYESETLNNERHWKGTILHFHLKYLE